VLALALALARSTLTPSGEKSFLAESDDNQKTPRRRSRRTVTTAVPTTGRRKQAPQFSNALEIAKPVPRSTRKAAAAVEAAPRSATVSVEKSKSRKPRPRPASPVRAMPRAKYSVGQIVRHRYFPFRGVIYDIDPVYNNTDEWWLSIPPERRPRKDQPFYHLLAENAETEYIAYVSEQNLLPDDTGVRPRHPRVKEMFRESKDGSLRPVFIRAH
jgi:heat shock protein HspQ